MFRRFVAIAIALVSLALIAPEVATGVESATHPKGSSSAPPYFVAASNQLCGAPRNEWGYNHCGGKAIYEPARGFCGTFSCMNNFNRGRGYVVQCRSGFYSKSGGIRGACSRHGGVARTLYR